MYVTRCSSRTACSGAVKRRCICISAVLTSRSKAPGLFFHPVMLTILYHAPMSQLSLKVRERPKQVHWTRGSTLSKDNQAEKYQTGLGEAQICLWQRMWPKEVGQLLQKGKHEKRSRMHMTEQSVGVPRVSKPFKLLSGIRALLCVLQRSCKA